MGVSSSESHDLTAFYELLTASFGVLSQNTGFYPSLDRIVGTTLGPLNLGPGGGSYNEPISCLHRDIDPASIQNHFLCVRPLIGAEFPHIQGLQGLHHWVVVLVTLLDLLHEDGLFSFQCDSFRHP